MARRILCGGGVMAAVTGLCLLPREHPTSGVHPSTMPVAVTNGVELPARNWPNLFGPTQDSRVTDPGIQLAWPDIGPRRVWHRTLGGGYSSPVVWADRLVVAHRVGNEEVVACLDARQGTTCWEFRYPTRFVCRLEYSDGPYSTPVVDGRHVYVVGAEGQIHCLGLTDGRLVWRRELAREVEARPGEFPFGAGLLLDGERLIVNVGGSLPGTGIVALNRRTGATVWAATDHGASYTTPVAATVHGQRFVFVFTREGLVSLEPAGGDVDWVIPFRPANPDTTIATTPLVHGDRVFASSYQLGAMCVTVQADRSHAVAWKNRRSLDSQHNNLVERDGWVYGFSARQHAFGCVSLADGSWRWQWKSALDRACTLDLGGTFLLWGETGQLALVRAHTDRCEPVGVSESLLPGPCFSAPAFSDGRLYLRNEKTLLCLDLRPRRGTSR